MTKSGEAIVVLDPYDWLPGYGENGVEAHSEGLDWKVEITYDDSSADNQRWRRTLVFRGVCCFCQALSPGGPTLSVDYPPSGDNLGALLEYPDSQAALGWRSYLAGFARSADDVKHFAMVFLSANNGYRFLLRAWF
jgi:hypothetical protein